MKANVFQRLCFTMLTNVREEAQSGAETRARKSRVRAMVSPAVRRRARGTCSPLSWGYTRAGTGETERGQSATGLCRVWPSPATSSSESWDQVSHFQSCSPTPETISPGAEKRDLYLGAVQLPWLTSTALVGSWVVRGSLPNVRPSSRSFVQPQERRSCIRSIPAKQRPRWSL